jgi:hypothetical protein
VRGIDLGVALRSFKVWLAAAVSSILSLEGSRRDAAVRSSFSRICESTIKTSYEVPCSRTVRSFYLARQLPTGLRYSSVMFRLIYRTSWASNVLTKHRFMKRCTSHL